MNTPKEIHVRPSRAVFISYAHADNENPDPAKRWLDRLLQQLRPLAFEDIIEAATDRDIGLGEDWHGKIQADLNRAGAAVLLGPPVSRACRASMVFRRPKESAKRIWLIQPFTLASNSA